jgi:hypothetical protein
MSNQHFKNWLSKVAREVRPAPKAPHLCSQSQFDLKTFLDFMGEVGALAKVATTAT